MRAFVTGGSGFLGSHIVDACLARGVHLAPSAYEVGFLSTAHTDDDIDRAVAVFGEALREAHA